MIDRYKEYLSETGSTGDIFAMFSHRGMLVIGLIGWVGFLLGEMSFWAIPAGMIVIPAPFHVIHLALFAMWVRGRSQ